MMADAEGTGVRELADAELARRIAAGGEGPAEAEEAELCRRFARRVFFFGLRRLGSEDRAQDLVQDVLVTALGKLRAGEVREPDRLGSFILGVARMCCHSQRRRAARDEPMAEEVAKRLAAAAAPPDPLAREHVVRCLQALEDRQRTVLVLTFYAEQSADEIASSLGLTANNVRVIRHRGIARVRGCMGLDAEGVAA